MRMTTTEHDTEPCEACAGLGVIPTHQPSCDDDLCVLNGDIHSCLGTFETCDECLGSGYLGGDEDENPLR